MSKDLGVMDLNTVGKRVAFARKSRSLTQQELAERAAIAQSSLASLEKGRNKGSRSLVRLAKVLNVSPGWLDTGDAGGRSLSEILSGGYYLGQAKGSEDIQESVVGAVLQGLQLDTIGVRLLSWTARSIFDHQTAYHQAIEGQRRFNWPYDHSPEAFLLRVPFDQYIPMIKSGELLLIEPNHEPSHGGLVVAMNAEGEIMLGKILDTHHGKMVLQAKEAGGERLYSLDSLVVGGMVAGSYRAF